LGKGGHLVNGLVDEILDADMREIVVAVLEHALSNRFNHLAVSLWSSGESVHHRSAPCAQEEEEEEEEAEEEEEEEDEEE